MKTKTNKIHCNTLVSLSDVRAALFCPLAILPPLTHSPPSPSPLPPYGAKPSSELMKQRNRVHHYIIVCIYSE